MTNHPNTNHPNRGNNPNRPGRTPRPHEVKEARQARGMTQEASARVVYCSLNSWQKWEAGERRMHPATWELYLKKTKVLPKETPEAPRAPPGDDEPAETGEE